MGGRTQGVKMKTQQVTDRANKYAFELILTNPLAVSVYYRLDVRKATSLLFSPLNHLETGTIFCSNGRCPRVA